MAVARTRDGHLAVMESAAPLDADEPADAKLTVTAYELDDEGFGELRERWEAREAPTKINPLRPRSTL